MSKMNYFTSRGISDRITVIEDPVGVKCYLIIGDERAALIDTATGLGDLAEYVQNITSLPYVVICTHGHIDHAGGASRFGEVYLNPEDFALEKRHCSDAMKRKQNELIILMGGEPVPDKYISPARNSPFAPLSDGMEFYLGGIKLRACIFRGHTQGMTSVLLKEERAILFGDACNPRVFLFGPEASSVEAYRESLLEFKAAHAGEYDTVYLSHGPSDTIDPSVLDECVVLCGEIMERRDDAAAFEFMDECGTIAKVLGPDGMRKDGKLANIVYNPQRIFGK